MRRVLLTFFMALPVVTLSACSAQSESPESPKSHKSTDVQPQEKSSTELKTDMEWTQSATDIIAKNENVSGVSVILVKDGEIYGYTNFGTLERTKPGRISETTNFQIASLSKIFTGVIAKNMILEGKISPDDQVLNFMPDDLSTKAKQNLTGVTIRDVLNHRSGLPRDTKVVIRQGNDPMLTGLSEDGLLKDMEIANMVGTPGAQYEYSNLGYALMGYVLERASGQTYAELVDKFILVPYGLNKTYVHFPDAQKSNLATPYRKENRNQSTKPWITGKLISASGIYSTTEDLGKLMQAQIKSYNTGELDQPLVLTNDSRIVSATRYYGYGMNKDKFRIGDTTYDFYYHSGDMDGFAAVYMMLPEKKSGVVVLTSSGGGWKNGLGVLLLKKIMGQAVNMPEKK